MRIQHNITAMNAYRNYNNNTSAIGKNLEKLSSGYKINRAGDDAAGLAVSQKMRLQIAGLAQAQKNAKSGISYVQTAEGALQEVHEMLERMYTLAEQSANGTFDSDTDRTQLQKEVNSLMEEIDRIGKTANFNGMGIFSQYEGGTGSNTAVPTATLDTTANGTGISTTDGDVSFSFAANATDEQKAALNKALGKDGSTIKVTVGNTKKELSIAGLEGYTLLKGYDGSNTVNAANGKITLASNSSSSALKNGNNTVYDLTIADEEGNEVGVLKFKVGTLADGTSDIKVAAGEPATTYEATEGAAKGLSDFGIGSIDLSSLELTEDAAVSAEYKGGSDKKLVITVGDTEYTSDGLTTTTGAKGKTFELSAADGSKISVIVSSADNKGLGGSNAIAKAEIGTAKAADSAGDTPGTISFWIGAEAGDANQLTIDTMSLEVGDISIADPEDTGVGVKLDGKVTKGDISKVDITTAEKAMSFLETIKSASDSVSNMRGTLGAMQNRLDHTLKNLSVMQENMQDAESVIRDTDVADEMMAYTKNNILVQSAQAMLAQANQIPQGVLQLLQ